MTSILDLLEKAPTNDGTVRPSGGVAKVTMWWFYPENYKGKTVHVASFTKRNTDLLPGQDIKVGLIWHEDGSAVDLYLFKPYAEGSPSFGPIATLKKYTQTNAGVVLDKPFYGGAGLGKYFNLNEPKLKENGCTYVLTLVDRGDTRTPQQKAAPAQQQNAVHKQMNPPGAKEEAKPDDVPF